jgi:hypothetical protein
MSAQYRVETVYRPINATCTTKIVDWKVSRTGDDRVIFCSDVDMAYRVADLLNATNTLHDWPIAPVGEDALVATV